MSEHLNDVRYSESVETISPEEADTIGGIIETMTRESRTAAARDGQTVRASHAKSGGLLKGKLEVLPNLPASLKRWSRPSPA